MVELIGRRSGSYDGMPFDQSEFHIPDSPSHHSIPRETMIYRFPQPAALSKKIFRKAPSVQGLA